MEAIAHFADSPRVIPIEGRRAVALCRQLSAALPTDAQVEIGRHPQVDHDCGLALTLQLPARPNATLPGRLHPASVAFAIEISWRLLQRHFSNPTREQTAGAALADWIALHVAGAAPTAGSADTAPLLVWRFTTPLDDISDICVQRVRAA